MIVYNMRYRGSMEYDKFVLNYLQHHNEVNDIIYANFHKGLESSSQSLADVIKKLDTAFDKYTSETGYSQKLFEQTVTMRRL